LLHAHNCSWLECLTLSSNTCTCSTLDWKQVAYWLVQHDVSVMMAACDTFRSGAVEQLRTHARRLQVRSTPCGKYCMSRDCKIVVQWVMDMTKWFLKNKASYLYTVFWVMSYESKLMDGLDVW
jgi:hypothetical protein